MLEARIIFLSADIAVKEEALKAGTFIFLKKPANLKDIIDAIHKSLSVIPAKT